MLMSLVTMLTMMSMVSAYGAVQDQRCEDCITVVAGLQDASLSNESLTMQMGMILQNICPDADLGAPDDHPNCEKFTEHHFPDLAGALFSYYLAPQLCAHDLGFCPMPFKGFKEVDCDTCKSITRLIAGLMTMEDTRVSLVEYLASDFCINGVPAGDVEFCDRYVRTVMPDELAWFAHSVDLQAMMVCDYFFDIC